MITLKVPSDSQAPRVSRSHLNELRDVLEPRFSDVALVLSELVTNSVRHSGEDEDICVEVQATGKSIRVEVSDSGPCFSKESPRNGGMGLDIVEKIADQWGVRHDGACTVWVELSKEEDH